MASGRQPDSQAPPCWRRCCASEEGVHASSRRGSGRQGRRPASRRYHGFTICAPRWMRSTRKRYLFVQPLPPQQSRQRTPSARRGRRRWQHGHWPPRQPDDARGQWSSNSSPPDRRAPCTALLPYWLQLYGLWCANRATKAPSEGLRRPTSSCALPAPCSVSTTVVSIESVS